MKNMLLRPVVVAVAVVGLASLAWAESVPSFSLEYAKEKATHVVVVDADGAVLESLRGDLAKGDKLPFKAAKKPIEVVNPFPGEPRDPKVASVSGNRRVLFLIRAKTSDFWTPAGFLLPEARFATVWIEEGQCFAIYQFMNPGDGAMMHPLNLDERRLKWEAIPVPAKTPFDGNERKKGDYLYAYRNGYSYAQGKHFMCPTNPSDDNLHAIRGWIEGWQAGVKDGGPGDLPAKYAPYQIWRDDGKAPPATDAITAELQARKAAASAPDAKAVKDLYFHFHRGVPASELKVELASGAKIARSQNKLVLPVKVTNNSPDEISTMLAHEWHGGLWPPTGLYASVSSAKGTKDSGFVPVYLVGEHQKATEATILAAGKSKELMLRMDWPGTGSVRADPLIKSAGTYKVQVRLVFEVSGKQQYVTSPSTTVELPGVKHEPWAGEPVVPIKWVSGGKLSTFKRLPKADDVTALRINRVGNRTDVDLTAANFPGVLDSMKAVKADDPKYKVWSYADWCSAEFETSAGQFRVTFYLGELALLAAHDGSVGLVTYERPK